MAYHCLLVCIVSGEKLAVNLIKAPLYMMTSNFLLLSKFFVFRQFDQNVPQFGFLSLSYLEFVELLEFVVMSFLKFGEFLTIILSNILCVPSCLLGLL